MVDSSQTAVTPMVHDWLLKNFIGSEGLTGGDDQAYDKPKNTTGTGRRPDLAVHHDLIRRFFETRFQASAIKAAAIVRVSNEQGVEEALRKCILEMKRRSRKAH